MTDEKINFAIAEACGLEHDASALGLKAVREGEYRGVIPSYTTDLNAMHEAEKTLNGVQQFAYMGELARLDTYCTWSSMTATARQRAEAFLRTLGKWEEAQP